MAVYASFFWSVSALCALIPGAYAFSFNTTTPTQCGNLSVAWTGGTPPFQLVMYRPLQPWMEVPIPTTAFSSGAGSITFQLPFSSKQQFVISMSDATSTVTTNFLTTGESQGGNCDTPGPGNDFMFHLDSPLQQCSEYPVTQYSGAVQPVTFIGTIPGGQTFKLVPPTGSTSFDWLANVAAGTSMLFSMVDASGRNGGTSNIEVVGVSDDAACLDSSPLSSTSASATSSSTSASSASISPTPTFPSPSMTSEHRSSTAAIVGGVIGGLGFLAAAVTLGLFFLRKRKSNSNSTLRKTSLDLTYDPAHRDHRDGDYPYSSAVGASASPLPSTPGYNPTPFTNNYVPQQPHQQASHASSSPYAPSRYRPPSSHSNQLPPARQSSSLYQQPSQHQSSQYSVLPLPSQQRSPGSEADSFNPYTLTSNTSSSVGHQFEASDTASTTISSVQEKLGVALMSGHTPSRFIVHTDVEDGLPPNRNRIVELPPQYSERRGAPHVAAATAGPSHVG